MNHTLDTDRHVKSDDTSKQLMIFVATTTQFWSGENISCINLFVAFKKKLTSFTSEMEYSGGRNGCSILECLQGFKKQILLELDLSVQGPLKQMDGIALNGPELWQDWLKPCKWLRFLSKTFEKYFQMDNFIDKMGD